MKSRILLVVLILANASVYASRKDQIQLHKAQDSFLENDFLFEYNNIEDYTLPHAYLSNGDIRLTSDEGEENRTIGAGRLELYMETLLVGSGDPIGTWGTVCGDTFSMKEANVACRQLGFMSALNWTFSSLTEFGQGNASAPIFLNGVKCPRRDLHHLMRCRPSSEDSTSCSHDYDIALYCDPTTTVFSAPYKGQVRLVAEASNSSNPTGSSGRVEVYQAGTWGTVCNREFNQAAADSVCRQLGYTDAIAMYTAMPGSGLVWVDDITCNTSSSCFTSCYKTNHWSHTCNHTSDVAIQCSYDVSLALENTAGNKNSCRIGVFPLSMLILVIVLSLAILMLLVLVTGASIALSRFLYRRRKTYTVLY